MEIRTFPAGSLFGVKQYSNTNRIRQYVATVGGYNRDQHAFNTTWTSPEGVTNGTQVARFENITDAEELAERVEGDIVRQRGQAEFVKLPVYISDLNRVVWLWTNSRKLNYIAPSAMSRFRSDYPNEVERRDEFGYHDHYHDHNREQNQEEQPEQPSRYTYRGFFD